MRQMVGVLAAAALLLTGTSPVQAKPMHPVPYEPLPGSYEELPQGGTTTLPWWQDGVLHVGGRDIETKFSRIAHRNGTTVVGKGSGYPLSKTEWYLVGRKRLKPLVTTGTVGLPTISANGRWIAWLKKTYLSDPYGELGATDTVHELVVYDAQKRKVVDRFRNRRTVYDDGVNGMGMWGLDNRGRVAFGIAGQDYIWRPGHRPTTLKGRSYDNYLDLDSWPRGITQFARIQDAGLYGTVDRKGRFSKKGLVELFGVWSSGGDAYLYATEAGELWVDRIDDGLRVQLGVPAGDDFLRPVGWESDTTVIAWLHETYGDEKRSLLVRCDAVTGDCQRVEGGPTAGTRAEMQERT